MQKDFFFLASNMRLIVYLQLIIGSALGMIIAHQKCAVCKGIFRLASQPGHCCVSVRLLERQLLVCPALKLLLRTGSPELMAYVRALLNFTHVQKQLTPCMRFK